MRPVRRGSISSELIMCGGDVRSILLLHLVVRCLETIYILSVYSPFSDRGELPLHNIPSSSSAISASTL